MPFAKAKIKIGILLAIAAAAAAGIGLFYAKQPTRYAVFAGYNADGTIAPYVISYLKGLNEVSDGVVYIADSALRPEETKKLKGLVIHTEHIRHQEYDFGSYKRGYNWLKENGYLAKADEVIFANDSCYAPLHSFKPMFKEMAARPELDFWGDLQNTVFNPHIQSYFMVFRKKILRSKSFAAFLNKIHHQDDPIFYISEYETKLTLYLESLGYKWDSYMPYKELSFLKEKDKNSYPLTLISRYRHQFLKRRTFTEKLLILEDKSDLLRWLNANAPQAYKDITADIAPFFIPQDLIDVKEKK